MPPMPASTRQSAPARTRSVALVGARGHTGAELLRLIDSHPLLTLGAATSRELAGSTVADHTAGAHAGARFEDLTPHDIAARAFDIVILALPNGKSGPYVKALDEAAQTQRPLAAPTIVDLSADWRFDDSGRWVYGLPEHFRHQLAGAMRIANPGCYATGMQLAIRPLRDLLDGPAHVFGVSGYSGAGTTPSDRNDPEKLRDNLVPYALVDHTHEREASRHLEHAVAFHPHVASFFRGIMLTVSLRLRRRTEAGELRERLHAAYDGEPLIRVQEEAPLVREIAGKHEASIGGVAVAPGGMGAVVVVTLDNLLKGAATQAMQNINLACGLPEWMGILA